MTRRYRSAKASGSGMVSNRCALLASSVRMTGSVKESSGIRAANDLAAGRAPGQAWHTRATGEGERMMTAAMTLASFVRLGCAATR
ncbi:hypothetical protein Shyhy01_59540 [Streptomyces hygroscopicus subsp. hygroscopicus]|nr:hypothetical protein Shyhy01_59540 [Streptomyces hygroscopicus subsp. hygroscopicus]